MGRGSPGSQRRSPRAAGRRSYLGALVQQRLCHRPADALRRAGHQRHFAVHVHGAAAAGRLRAAAAFMFPGARLHPGPAPSCEWAGRKRPARAGHPGLCHLALERSQGSGRARSRRLPDSPLNPGHSLPSTAGCAPGRERTGRAERLFRKKIALRR